MGLDMYLKVKIWTSKYTLPELNKKLLKATLEETCKIIEKALSLDENYELVYCSSW